jgi:hypothetical protein
MMADERPAGAPPDEERSGQGDAAKPRSSRPRRPASGGARRKSAQAKGGAQAKGAAGAAAAKGSGGTNAAQPASSPPRKRTRRTAAKPAAGAVEAEQTADEAEQTAVTAALPAEPVPAAAAAEAAEPDAPAGDTAPAEDAAAPRGHGAVRRALTSQRAPRLRTGISTFLVVAAILGVLVSALTLWAHRIVFDTDSYVRVVAPVAQDPEVRSSVAEFVAAKAVQAVDLNDRIESALPSSAKMAAPALTQALQQYLAGEIRKLLATDAAQRLWVDINRFAHQQLISALRDDNRFVTVGRTDVKLNLLPLVAVALQKLEDKIPQLLGKDVTLPQIDPATAPDEIRTLLQDALGRKLPAGFGTVTLLRGDTGYQAKQALRLFDDLMILVVILTVVLVAAALLVAVRRWRTALWLGLGALLAFAGARAAEVRLEKAAVDAIKTQGGAAVARSVLTSAIASLNGFLVWIAVAGAIVAVAAFLAGRPEWLRAMGDGFAHLFGVASDLSTPDTRAGRWMAEHLDVLRVGGVAVAVVVLLFVTGSVAGVIAVVLALVVYELALTAYGAGIPRELDEPAAGEAAEDEEEPAA